MICKLNLPLCVSFNHKGGGGGVQVKFYPYKKWGGKGFSPVQGEGLGGGGHNKF